MHCNEMEMILRRLRALRAYCHLRLHERLNRQWNELFYWVEYRVPRGLRMTITRSSRLFALALTPLVLLLLSSRLLMRAMVRMLPRLTALPAETSVAAEDLGRRVHTRAKIAS